MHVADRAHGQVFSLDLSPARERSLWVSADPAAELARHVRRAFEALKLPPLAFFAHRIEVSRRTGKLHVHGAFVTKLHSRDQLVAGLMRAGGKLTGHAASRQLVLKPFDHDRGGPSGWEGYTWADSQFTARKLGVDKLAYISRDLKRLAKHSWERRRREDKSTFTYLNH